MRTTLDISDDVLFAAKSLARQQKKSLGQVISDLARQAFAQPVAGGVHPASNARVGVEEDLAEYGIRPLPPRGTLVSNALIDRLREAEGI